jgi:ketosteroid isomerase-like protein
MDLSHEDAARFAQAWIEAWNSRDVDAILSHYADDVSFSSPFVVKLSGRENGMLNGKDELRAYFLSALETFPDLHFADLTFFIGMSEVVLAYRSVWDVQAAEYMQLNEALQAVVVRCHYHE